MGTATRKAAKAMSLRTNLSMIAADKGASMVERQAAAKAHRAVNNSWGKRYSNNVRGFYDAKQIKLDK